LGVEVGVFDSGVGDVAYEGFFNVADAVGDVFGVSLCDQFDGAVAEVSD